MSNVDIVDQVVANVNIAEVLFEAVEQTMPDHDEEFRALLRRVGAQLGQELYFDLEMAINLRVGQAMEDGFNAGWQLRGKC